MEGSNLLCFCKPSQDIGFSHLPPSDQAPFEKIFLGNLFDNYSTMFYRYGFSEDIVEHPGNRSSWNHLSTHLHDSPGFLFPFLASACLHHISESHSNMHAYITSADF